MNRRNSQFFCEIHWRFSGFSLSHSLSRHFFQAGFWRIAALQRRRQRFDPVVSVTGRNISSPPAESKVTMICAHGSMTTIFIFLGGGGVQVTQHKGGVPRLTLQACGCLAASGCWKKKIHPLSDPTKRPPLPPTTKYEKKMR